MYSGLQTITLLTTLSGKEDVPNEECETTSNYGRYACAIQENKEQHDGLRNYI